VDLVDVVVRTDLVLDGLVAACWGHVLRHPKGASRPHAEEARGAHDGRCGQV